MEGGCTGCFALAAPQEAGGPQAVSANANSDVRAATITDVRCLAAEGIWLLEQYGMVASPGVHQQIAPDAGQVAVSGVRSGFVAGLLACLRAFVYDVSLVAGSLLDIDDTQLRHELQPRRDKVWQ